MADSLFIIYVLSPLCLCAFSKARTSLQLPCIEGQNILMIWFPYSHAMVLRYFLVLAAVLKFPWNLSWPLATQRVVELKPEFGLGHQRPGQQVRKSSGGYNQLQGNATYLIRASSLVHFFWCVVLKWSSSLWCNFDFNPQCPLMKTTK